MTEAEFDGACRALAGATMVIQWGADAVYKVGDKVFAIAGGGGFTLKATEIAFEALTEGGRARRAPYLPRGGWLRFDNLAGEDGAEVVGWLKTSHALVAAGLPRARRAELGIG